MASTARPVRVRVKNSQRPTKTATAPASTQRLCGRMVAPRIRIGVSPEKAGKRWSCLSKTSCATPRMKIEAPMVMMISDTTGAPRAGSIASLLSADADRGGGGDREQRRERQRQAGHVGEDGDHAAEHDELALGEVHHVRGVVDDGEAEGDERIDRADRHPGQQELHEFGIGCPAPARGWRGQGAPGPAGPGGVRPALLDERPAAVLDLEHPEGREVEAEVVLRRHGHHAGRPGEARGRLDRVADRLGLGRAGRVIASTRIAKASWA